MNIIRTILNLYTFYFEVPKCNKREIYHTGIKTKT